MNLSTEVIEKGFWNHWIYKSENKYPVKTVTELEDYKPTNVLCLWITQLGRSAYKQSKLIEGWCEKLPHLDEVKYLWLTSRVNQKIFDSICEMTGLEGLWIKWSGIKNIDKLENLRSLRHFHLGSSAQVESISVMSKMKSLITLEVEQLNKISDFSPLSELTQLQGLGIDGSIWTTQKIDTLAFIKPLINLRYFTMLNTLLIEKSFDPILSLKKLERFNSSWNYPESEFEKLKQLPNLRLGNIETSWEEINEKMEREDGW